MSLAVEQLELESCANLSGALEAILNRFSALSGTIHILDADNLLHLAASRDIPEAVLERIRTIPVGKGMAGLAVERRQPVSVCNIQTDLSGDVQPGAKATGLQGAIALPIFRGEAVIGALGIAVPHEHTFSEGEINELAAIGRILANKFIGNLRSTAA